MVRKKVIDTVLVFLVYPIFAIPNILIGIKYNKQYAYCLFAIFMGYVGLLFSPSDDYYRYVEDFWLYRTFTFEDLSDYLLIKFDYVKPILYWVLGKLGFVADSTRFVFNFIGYFLLFCIFRDITFLASERDRRCFFLILLLFIGYIASLPRFGLASILFVYGMYRVLNQKTLGWLFCILGCLTHFSIIVAFLVFLIGYLIHVRFSKKWIGFCIMFSLFFNTDLLSPVLYLIGDSIPMVSHVLNYTDGYWANEFYNEASVYYRIYALLGSIPYYVLLYTFYRFYKESRLSRIIIIFLIFIIIVSPFRGISSRYQTIVLYLLLIYAISNFSENQFPTRALKHIFILVGGVSFFLNIWTNRLTLSLSYEYKLLAPSCVIWNSEYPEIWYQRHIDYEGHPIP